VRRDPRNASPGIHGSRSGGVAGTACSKTVVDPLAFSVHRIEYVRDPSSSVRLTADASSIIIIATVEEERENGRQLDAKCCLPVRSGTLNERAMRILNLAPEESRWKREYLRGSRRRG